jgi:dipeptidyl-peptidase-4
MGDTEAHAAAYARADLSKYAANLAGRLLIIHGLRDENVLFAHTSRLVAVLNASQARYELLVLPEVSRSVTCFETRVLVERRVFEHIMASFR